uniref:Uncharacterized protein n=1 Tax=Rousettus aegyptiacus TaxID=9407 RepID=A0A7J8KBF7_ROUAE|nr:hypothetical protein HJG63_008005 [Rousettus aegyptiacus]
MAVFVGRAGAVGAGVVFSGYHLECFLNQSISHWISVLTLLPVLQDRSDATPLGRYSTLSPSPPVRASSSTWSSRFPEKCPAGPTLPAPITLHCKCLSASVSLLLDCELPDGRNSMFFPLSFLGPSTVPGHKDCQ